jgi:DNA repair exonuclease SbcCD ATPase subunit
MLLKRLDLQNFRVFYGAHTIDFASKPGQSVTVFHGENGAGKTTLLNAIHWCLTGEFTPRFKNDGSWLNKDAVREGDADGFVELWFEHNDKDYRVRRGVTSGRSTFSLVEVVDLAPHPGTRKHTRTHTPTPGQTDMHTHAHTHRG